MPVVRRLVLLLSFPLLATIVFASWAVISTGRQAEKAGRLQSLVTISAAVGEVAHQLSQERLAAAEVLLQHSRKPDTRSYLQQAAITDQAIAEYRDRRASLNKRDPSLNRLLLSLDTQLDLLPAFRQQVKARNPALSATIFGYRVIVSQALTLRETVGQVGGADGTVADYLRAAAALSRAAEYAGLQQVLVLTGNGAPLTQAMQQEIAANYAGYDETLLTVGDRAPGQWQAWLNQALTGPQILAAQRWDDEVARTEVGSPLRVNPSDWLRMTGERTNRLHEVRARIDAEITAEVGSRRVRQLVTTLTLASIAVVLVVVTCALAVVHGRALVRRLRQVRDAAKRMAEAELPAIVRQIDDADPTDSKSMPAPPGALTPQLPGRDEVTEVAEAFDLLAQRTFDTAVAVAHQRQVVIAAVEAVARRCQGATNRLETELDKAERDERDPDQLDTLFRLDNLVAQLRQFVQNLLILAGKSLGTVYRQPASLTTVAQAAMSRIQHYPRVTLGQIDDRVMVPPTMIDDLVHMLASLLDNATRYGPGDTVITAHLLVDRVLIQVTDQGSGIRPDLLTALNCELSQPIPTIDVAHIRRQGLATVALLASVHGLQVRLVPTAPCGTVAEVEIPAQKITIAKPLLPAGPTAGQRVLDGTAATDWSTLNAPRYLQSERDTTSGADVNEAGSSTREVTKDSSAWFTEGGTVDVGPLPAAGKAPSAISATGLPMRQPAGTSAPLRRTGPGGTPRGNLSGISATAAAFQRGLRQRRPNLPKGQS